MTALEVIAECRARSIGLRVTQDSDLFVVEPPVERWFATLTERWIRRGTHRSTRQLEEAIRLYLRMHNEDPKPFKWHKTADEILAAVAAFCGRISDSGH